MFKPFLTSYLSFTRKERTGIIVVVSIILICSVIPLWYSLFAKTPPKGSDEYKNEMAALKLKQQDSNRRYADKKYDEDRYPHYRDPQNRNNSSRGELFYFDPNTISTNDWKRLGLRDKTIATIQNYLSKGGHFYKPEDIGKIWGLYPDEVERLLPYITIKEVQKENKAYSTSFYEKKEYKKERSTVNINTGDTAAFIALPGIGSKLANRIVNYRNKLGGFYKVEQVAETFGLPDSTFQIIKDRLSIDTAAIHRLNINNASLDDLKQHPYIRYQLANAIVQYRTQHGSFLKKEDIKKIMLVTDEMYAKLVPYLTID
jgi:competence protein ComEA